jgi:hypothetical protein
VGVGIDPSRREEAWEGDSLWKGGFGDFYGVAVMKGDGHPKVDAALPVKGGRTNP